MPSFVNVRVVVENDQALDGRTQQEGWLSAGRNPGECLQ